MDGNDGQRAEIKTQAAASGGRDGMKVERGKENGRKV